MGAYLIADGGSTKTEWCFIKKGKKPVSFFTSGINPYLESPDGIRHMLQNELPTDSLPGNFEHLIYFGAGAGSPAKQTILKKILQDHFAVPVKIHSDLMAAAIGLCGDARGMAAILGTGSSSCYYDGKKIKLQQPSLGYLAGDEGSGNHMGKRVLQYYTYGTFDDELRMAFEMKFGSDLQVIINKLYHEPYPNRYLASFTALLVDNRGHYMVENIIEDCLNDFFRNNLLKYRQSWKYPLNFTGSVSFFFRDVVQNLCGQYELELGKIEKSPMAGLIEFYGASPH